VILPRGCVRPSLELGLQETRCGRARPGCEPEIRRRALAWASRRRQRPATSTRPINTASQPGGDAPRRGSVPPSGGPKSLLGRRFVTVPGGRRSAASDRSRGTPCPPRSRRLRLLAKVAPRRVFSTRGSSRRVPAALRLRAAQGLRIAGALGGPFEDLRAARPRCHALDVPTGVHILFDARRRTRWRAGPVLGADAVRIFTMAGLNREQCLQSAERAEVHARGKAR
jgi:hypothetical protein